MSVRSYGTPRRISRSIFSWASRDVTLTARTAHVPTFARAGVAWAADSIGLHRQPVYSAPRWSWWDSDGDGIAEPHLILEDTRVGQLTNSGAPTTAGSWTNSTWTANVAATSCIFGQTARLVTDPGGGSKNFSQQFGTFVNGQNDVAHVIVEAAASNAATVTDLGVYDFTASAFVAMARFTWATKTSAIVTGAGTTGVVNLGNGRYLVWCCATGTAAGTGAAGHARYHICYPSGLAANTAAVIVHHAQAEGNSAFPTTPIVTGGSTYARPAETLYWTLLAAPQPLTLYVKLVQGAPIAYAGGIAYLGNSAGSGARLTIDSSGSFYRLTHNNGSTSVTVTLAAAPNMSDVVELFATLFADGSVQLSQSINGAATTATAQSAANALATAWSDTRLYLNSIGAATIGYHRYQALKILAGAPSVASTRSAY
jgi:hypothetical protein